MDKNAKIFIAGHNGLVGSALYRGLRSAGYTNLLTRPFSDLNLGRQSETELFFSDEKPDYVFLAAAKVGGILANNTYRAQFIYENLMIQSNVIHAAWKTGVKKLLFLGSSCIYPKLAPQPMKEEYLLTGLLEHTNEPYAIAKIAGIKMCESYYHQYGCDFISVMPTNLYGFNDNYDLENSHVLPALIRKFHLARCLETNDWPAIRHDLNKRPVENIDGLNSEREILDILAKYGVTASEQDRKNNDELVITLENWGSGNVYREFLHVDDMAAACIHVMNSVSSEQLYRSLNQTHINIGTGIDLTIKELADGIQAITGFEGVVRWDQTKPDGTPRKQLDTTIISRLGWSPRINLMDGIRGVYSDYLNQ